MIIHIDNQDIFDSPAQTLVSPINTQGIMNTGLARQFKDRYPRLFRDFRKRYRARELKVGEPYPFLEGARTILMFPTKDNWWRPSELQWIEQGLDYFVQHYRSWNVHSIAFPALGCGDGRLGWDKVKPVMVKKLTDLDIMVEIFSPRKT